MIRRSRISVRPNVKPAGRAAATSRETPQGNETPTDLSNDVGVKPGGQEVITEVKATSSVPAAETNNNSENQSGDVTSKSDLSVNTADMAGQSASTSALSRRRKRFSVLPNLSKPRSTPTSTITSSKLPKSPVRPEPTPEIPPTSTHTSSEVSESPDKHESTRESAPEPLPVSTKSLRSPVPKLPSSSISIHSTSRTSRFPSKAVITTERTLDKALSIPESAPDLPPAPVAPSDGKSKRRKPKNVTPTQGNVETSSSRLDEVEPQSTSQDVAESSCPVDPASVSESQDEPVVRDGNDLNSPGKSKKPQQHVPLALRTLNDPVDRLRLARAKKLRELLKKEMYKEKKEKNQRPQTGISERKKAKDHTKMTMRELIYYLPSTNPMKSYTEDEQRAETELPSSPKAASAVRSATEQNSAEEEEERGGDEEEPSLAPRVKVAEDGSLIIDEESLTVQVQRMKGPNPVEERDPIFERGSTTTYSSFRKGTYTKPWSNRETDMFFLAISMVGTDFSMIGQLFPHRARIEIKNKFKKEERANSWRIDKAFKEKRRLDLDYFNKLLAQILKDEDEKRKKNKHVSQMAKIPCQRPGERKRKIYSSDSEEDESLSSDAMEGEKEKENVCNDGGSSATPRRKRAGASQKRSRHANHPAEQEAEEEAERSANEESSPVNELDSVEEETESFGVKPVRRWRNRGPVVQRKAQDTHTSAREESTRESASNDSENEEPDLTTIQESILNKPTRSGRIPKLSQHMIHAAADEEDDEEEEMQLPALPLPPDPRPQGSRATRGRWRAPRRGKSKLLTLRASAAEDEDDDEEYDTNQEEGNDTANAEEENQAFVPMGLRSVTAVHSEVEETMEELDISVNVPDVLGISQNAVCPESSCERALTPMGSVPCEHQLDLLVDVIEFLAPDDMEVSEEAARTLLTIGHSALLTQTGEPSSTGNVIIVEESSSQVHEEVLTETMDQSETRVETCEPPVSTGDENLAPAPPQDSASMVEPVSSQGSEVLSNDIQPETSNVIVPEPTALKTQRNRLPKPNLSRASRTTQREPAEAVTSSAETFSAPVTSDKIAAKTQISTVKDFVPEAPSQLEPEELNSEICEERENDKTEGCVPVLSLEKMMEDEVSGRRTRIEEERREEMQQTHSESKSHSSGSECSVKPSQPVRRCRGPKPKPNLARSVRTTHIVTYIQQNHPEIPDEKQATANTFTDVQQPEEGANVIPEPERETTSRNDPVMVIPDAGPEDLPKSVCESSTSDEPVFILSLTEILPILTEGAGLVTDPLPLPAMSGSLSETISPVENATADVGGAGPAGDQVFSQLLADALVPVSEERETENGENETSGGKEEETSSRLGRRERSLFSQNTAAAAPPGGPDEPPVEPSTSSCKTEENVEERDLPAKRRKLPERSRRAKLQIKPNPIQRKTCHGLPYPDETRSAPASSCEMLLEETEPRQMSSSAILDTEDKASSSAISDENSKTSTTSIEQNLVISPTPVNTETPPSQASSASSSSSSSSSSSQGIVGGIDLSGTDPVEPSASGAGVGADSQPVHQITPLASTRPLMRPGRKPKGFLSFMSSTSTQRPSESTRAPQKPAIITSRTERRRAAPSTSAPLPPPPLHVSSHTRTETSSVNQSAAEEDEEPTSVAAYFFNDIFTVVEEQDELD
ncbi:transcription factor TFIIIB component B'' homolog isoform X2 [Ictalurus furcatus]|uniref:transcription factor TFIIIB component B'' homolog isoform X2 n=1 Tax=Ictalurus furcatus TaxID=66913 RepID=UPI00234FCB20|nr:transcription factor TFIIIB component B'' homolog isoform X2 [Ictalurus furcatus]